MKQSNKQAKKLETIDSSTKNVLENTVTAESQPNAIANTTPQKEKGRKKSGRSAQHAKVKSNSSNVIVLPDDNEVNQAPKEKANRVLVVPRAALAKGWQESTKGKAEESNGVNGVIEHSTSSGVRILEVSRASLARPVSTSQANGRNTVRVKGVGDKNGKAGYTKNSPTRTHVKSFSNTSHSVSRSRDFTRPSHSAPGAKDVPHISDGMHYNYNVTSERGGFGRGRGAISAHQNGYPSAHVTVPAGQAGFGKGGNPTSSDSHFYSRGRSTGNMFHRSFVGGRGRSPQVLPEFPVHHGQRPSDQNMYMGGRGHDSAAYGQNSFVNLANGSMQPAVNNYTMPVPPPHGPFASGRGPQPPTRASFGGVGGGYVPPPHPTFPSGRGHVPEPPSFPSYTGNRESLVPGQGGFSLNADFASSSQSGYVPQYNAIPPFPEDLGVGGRSDSFNYRGGGRSRGYGRGSRGGRSAHTASIYGTQPAIQNWQVPQPPQHARPHTSPTQQSWRPSRT